MGSSCPSPRGFKFVKDRSINFIIFRPLDQPIDEPIKSKINFVLNVEPYDAQNFVSSWKTTHMLFLIIISTFFSDEVLNLNSFAKCCHK